MEKIKEKFINLFEKRSSGCWEWIGIKDKDEYGRFTISHDKSVRAHRFSYECFVDKIPEKMCVLHKCDNPSCVNPEHLFIGTISANHRDMDQKGRRNSVYGEKHGMVKLDSKKVVEIRKIHESGKFFQREIANKFNISREMVGRIIRKQNWKHV